MRCLLYRCATTTVWTKLKTLTWLGQKLFGTSLPSRQWRGSSRRPQKLEIKGRVKWKAVKWKKLDFHGIHKIALGFQVPSASKSLHYVLNFTKKKSNRTWLSLTFVLTPGAMFLMPIFIPLWQKVIRDSSTQGVICWVIGCLYFWQFDKNKAINVHQHPIARNTVSSHSL